MDVVEQRSFLVSQAQRSKDAAVLALSVAGNTLESYRRRLAELDIQIPTAAVGSDLESLVRERRFVLDMIDALKIQVNLRQRQAGETQQRLLNAKRSQAQQTNTGRVIR